MLNHPHIAPAFRIGKVLKLRIATVREETREQPLAGAPDLNTAVKGLQVDDL
jgi:hypothetical protein